MKLLALLASLAVTIGLTSAQGAVIDSFSDTGCANYQATFNIPSNGGQCYAENPSQGIILRSLSGGCSSKFQYRESTSSIPWWNAHPAVLRIVTVYCDSSCSTCANLAEIGDCRSGVHGYSIDC